MPSVFIDCAFEGGRGQGSGMTDAESANGMRKSTSKKRTRNPVSDKQFVKCNPQRMQRMQRLGELREKIRKRVLTRLDS